MQYHQPAEEHQNLEIKNNARKILKLAWTILNDSAVLNISFIFLICVVTMAKFTRSQTVACLVAQVGGAGTACSVHAYAF